MTWFSLPPTQDANSAAFSDAKSTALWLASQPQANAPAMLAELLTQIEAFNLYRVSPRERFKTLEALRKAIFAVSRECQRRYENKPLPLLPAEQHMFDAVRRLWRACATAYLHCLRACLDLDASIAGHSLTVVHRALSCLRMEQMSAYLAGAELDGEFWQILHALHASAEQRRVAREPLADRLLGETSESTCTGQYVMALLLHLAQPYALTRSQFAATIRWLARWREQAAVLNAPETRSKACCLALDLMQDRPFHDSLQVAREGRWLLLNGVLRKMRNRLEQLAAGESPENLKLGNVLSPEACIALLNTLFERLRNPSPSPLPSVFATPDAAPELDVAVGLECIFGLLGGKGAHESEASSSFDSRLSAEQIAVFDHVVRDAEDAQAGRAETWRLVGPLGPLAQVPEETYLLRPADSVGARMQLKGILALRQTPSSPFELASIERLWAQRNGDLCLGVRRFAGAPTPLLVDFREKQSGRILRQPALMLAASQDAAAASVILPAGLPARASGVRFYETPEQTPLNMRLGSQIERGGDSERWSLEAGK